MKNGIFKGKDAVRYYKDDLLHREDGPAVEDADGFKGWYLHGKLHREDGPAVEDADGSKHWYLHGNLHREDGPAVEDADGSSEWYLHGKLHREDGPAVERADGFKGWYLHGKEFTGEAFHAFISQNTKKSDRGLSQGEEALVLKWVSEAQYSWELILSTLRLNGNPNPTIQEVIDYRAKLKFMEGGAMLKEYKRLSVKE